MTDTEKRTREELAALLLDAQKILDALNALSIRMSKIYPTVDVHYVTNRAWHNMEKVCRELKKRTE
jgi:hypothetical protein